MTTLKTMVRRPRSDGFYSVYIRIVHNRKPGYINTNKFVDPEHIAKDGEPTDPIVNEYCAMLILKYTERLNMVDTSHWSVKDVVEYLIKTNETGCFSDYARDHIARMEGEGHQRNGKNYRLALNHLERFLGTTQIMFDNLSASILKAWIESMDQTNRAKEMYPTCIRQIFKRALVELNDEERGIVRIKFNPWPKVQIPKSDTTEKLTISAEARREFFNRPLPKTKVLSPLPKLGRDIAMLSLCLGGINTVDLYGLKKEDYHGGILHYRRAKSMR